MLIGNLPSTRCCIFSVRCEQDHSWKFRDNYHPFTKSCWGKRSFPLRLWGQFKEVKAKQHGIVMQHLWDKHIYFHVSFWDFQFISSGTSWDKSQTWFWTDTVRSCARRPVAGTGTFQALSRITTQHSPCPRSSLCSNQWCSACWMLRKRNVANKTNFL